MLANSGMGLYKFRKELIEELISNGNQVSISVPKDEYADRLRGLGCNLVEVYINRRSKNPFSDLQLLLNYKRNIQYIKPDVVLTYTIKPNVYGGIACQLTKTPYITNITGLGTSLEDGGILRKVSLFLYKLGLSKASCVFFQNSYNRDFFIKQKIIKKQDRLIPGSGVNLKKYKYEEYPPVINEIRFLFIGRIMKAKGIEELLSAIKIVKKRYPLVHFDLIGGSEENYSDQLIELNTLGIINYHGPQENIQPILKESHATILPSYHEGTANVLLESASSGRPILASRVPGCIETFDEGITGFGFESRDVDTLVEAIIRFIQLPYEKKKKMGLYGRSKMEKQFSRSIVIDAYKEELKKINSKGNLNATIY